ncbi:MAG TPA: DNA repair protein RadC [Enhygromyxa sp.]|nr:DNA repair protein RadC [Enhygromyxa sp.]
MHLELVPDPLTNKPETPPPDRPRERLLLLGPGVLSDVELIALLLGGGRSMQRAHAVLDAVGGLAGLNRACAHELRELPGIGDAGATALAAAIELKRRIDRLALSWGAVLQTPHDAEAFLRSVFHGANQEHFVVIGLDARQRVRMLRTVGVGTLDRVEVHPREVFRPLLRAGMHSCLLAHNHPSGDATPSESDVLLTERMVGVGQFVGIPVVDHVVVSDHGFVSMAELGLIPSEGEGL